MGSVARRMRARYLALQEEAEAAIKHFENHSDFPAVQVQIADGIENLKRALTERSLTFQTPERLRFVVELLDVRAGRYLPLVADMESQKAYMNLVAAFGRRAIEEYTGWSAAEVLFSGQSDTEQVITGRVRHWTTEGHRRLAASGSLPVIEEPAKEPIKPEDSQGGEVARTRQGLAKPLLAKRGLTRSKWASKAGVNPSVVYGYLAGRSAPNPESRLALAKVLGVEVSDLPD